MTRARILADYVAGGTTAAEFDHMDGVTSNVQTQLNAKAPLASPAFTGTVAIPNVANLETAVVANTAKVTNATHTGDVTGGTALTIANDAVDSQHYAAGSIDAEHLHANAVFASGTKMIFNQTSAPTGWTKVTGSGNDTALRVTTGTVGTGGSVAFETAFASQTATVSGHTIVRSESYNFMVNAHDRISTSYSGSGNTHSTIGLGDSRTGTTGNSHTHAISAIDLDVSYVDVIIATKD